jgi:hypothetical protein
VTDEARMTAVFDQIHRDLPPLRGIFHAAGVLDDGTLSQQTSDRFRAVLSPKTLRRLAAAPAFPGRPARFLCPILLGGRHFWFAGTG